MLRRNRSLRGIAPNAATHGERQVEAPLPHRFAPLWDGANQQKIWSFQRQQILQQTVRIRRKFPAYSLRMCAKTRTAPSGPSASSEMRRNRNKPRRCPLSTPDNGSTVSYTHLRAHETGRNLVCRLLLEKK